MPEQMSTDLARRVAAHLRDMLDEARKTNWMAAPAVLGTRVERFAEKLETGDTRWVEASPSEQLANGAAVSSPFARNANDVLGPTAYDRKRDDAWDTVDELRRKMAATLVRTEGTPNGYRKVGYFAVVFGDATKFYRVTAPIGGKWDGRVFVDVQASDDYYPVKNPTSLATVLGAVLDDPEGCARRYARELGRCSRCARTLTDEESRAAGMGPDCRALVG